jgi:hypothetical protein
MPLALLAFGVLFTVAAVRGSHRDLMALLRDDFTGPGNFLIWVLAIAAVGAVGYVKPLRPISNAFLVLIFIVFLLAANRGGRDFFSSLVNQIRSTEG